MLDRTIAVALAVSLLAAPSALADPPSEHPPSNAPTSTWSPDRGIRKLSHRERRARMRALGQKYHEFLRNVEPIMLPSELDAFLSLDTDARRDAWIEHFWKIRDPNPATPRNEYRIEYPKLRAEVENRFGEFLSDQARVFLARGRPDRILRVEQCRRYLQPVEIWSWKHLPGAGDDVKILFYVPRDGIGYQLWVPLRDKLSRDLEDLFSSKARKNGIDRVLIPDANANVLDDRFKFDCGGGDEALAAIRWSVMNRFIVARMTGPLNLDAAHRPQPAARTLAIDPNVPHLDATMKVDYPGKKGSLTSTELDIAVPLSTIAPQKTRSKGYELDIEGEVLRDGESVDHFLYRFNAPADPGEDPLPLSVERFLHPDKYTVRVKLVDAGSGAEALLERDIDVPYITDADVGRNDLTAASANAQLDAESRVGVPRLRIVPMEKGPLTGIQHVDTIVAGHSIRSVEFYLDGRKLMTKRRPPFEIDVNLGSVPVLHRVKVVGLDTDDHVVTGDEAIVNGGSDPFRVRIVSPRVSDGVSGEVHVDAEVSHPAGDHVKSLDLYLNEDRVATLYSPPWVQTIHIAHPMDFAYIRAVATLADARGSKAEDVVYLSRPEFLEHVDVHLVELPTSVLRSGKPVDGLTRADFKVFDEGKEVPIAKFDHVRNLPLSIGIAIDTSLSMKTRLMAAQKAGASFLNNVLRPGDKAFLLSFNDEAKMKQKWTSNLIDMIAGLANLRADGNTTLYDAIVDSLYNFQGIRGQRALIVLSDGEDTASSFTYDQALEYARRSGVPIYVIGIAIQAGKEDVKQKLDALADATGGKSYYIRIAPDIGHIYDDIQARLRSQYLLGFYPPKGVKPGSKFRRVKVVVDHGGARTIAGYYP